MTIKYLKKSPKTSSSDDTKTREIVEGILKEKPKFQSETEQMFVKIYPNMQQK